jgi:hypothetical protein
MSEEEKSKKPASKTPTRKSTRKTDKPPSSENVLTVEDPALEVKEWASCLSAETRDASWIDNWYVMPDEVSALCRRLPSERGTIHALIGYQGTGKTSAVLAIDSHLRKSEPSESKKKSDPLKTIILKWRRPGELIADRLGRDDAFAACLKEEYRINLGRPWLKREPDLGVDSRRRRVARFIKASKALISLDFGDVEKELGKGLFERLRYQSFVQALSCARVILIDLPDYSKTDIRRVSSDLEAIYWIWNELTRFPNPPNIVISFQKEMFRGHYFLGKMSRVDLKPLKPEKLVEAYKKRFPDAKVFTEDALLLIAKMSRGVFRRFLRYITLALDHQEQVGASFPITVDLVRGAVPVQVLAEDMDQQLAEIFPRQPDLRTEAVKLLLHLEEHGPTSQTKTAELLELHKYTVIRLLSKLEDHRYVKRERQGVENVISLVQP